MATPLNRLKRLTANDIVNRMARSDMDHWLAMNQRCPTCCATLPYVASEADILHHMRGDCEKELVIIGLGWARRGHNVNAPLADAEARREVKAPRKWLTFSGRHEATNRTILCLAAFCLTLFGLIIYGMCR
ncbi:MAG: hypothetical protein WBA09_22130 [Candidatus Acidiferrum sp.]